ncbi:anti-adapter protein IraP [Enterobacter sp. R1(2018)]|jgi:restriction endonuclease S subunit|uniref:anti-adapter protein IraP n=1 Tax=Enterobacteriaceae TaxID=543 RepID=UPI000EACA9C1|nr:anti-adapter protein IraP [Enterobacter sp. R1(2018)]RKQ40844.1 anti-adapter protein IraP [Enterobacter sp. R1(2018)]
MKNLIAELLVKLAEKEEESKEFVAQIEALEIVVTALLRRMEQSEQQALITSIEGAMHDARPKGEVSTRDTLLLKQYLEKLLTHPRS